MTRHANEQADENIPPATAKARRQDGDLVQSLTRAISILEILADGGCRLKEISARSGLPPSTAHRLLTTLEQKRLVRFDREANHWDIGSNCYAIGAGFLRRQKFMTETVPRIKCLAGQLGTTVNLGMLDYDRILLVRQAKRPQMAPAQAPGASLPMHATAMGKVLLANSRAVGHAANMNSGFARLTDRTICDPSVLARQLHSIRESGIALDDEESMAGRRCIAAPIYNELGECVAAISVTDTSSQMTDATVSQLSRQLAETALDITMASGGYVQKRTSLQSCM